MYHPLLASRKGFSILVALGTVGVLLIIVIGIASVYQREITLSRMSYEDILTDARAEWAFEYAMLKVRNHREGFEDSMKTDDIDTLIFSGSSDRTKNTKTTYAIEAQTGSHIFTVGPDEHLILPLFVGSADLISTHSRNPSFSTGVTRTTGLQITWADANISWSIVAMSGSENVSLAGNGNIGTNEVGTMRLRWEDCLDSDGKNINCNAVWVEESLTYFYDLTGSVNEFLNSWGKFNKTSIKDPYILIFNDGESSTITIKSDTPYALPKLEVTAESRKGNSLKSIRFMEDKSRYYDALKYGVYDTYNP